MSLYAQNSLRPSERRLLEPYLKEIEKLQNENANLRRNHHEIESHQEEIIKNQLKNLLMIKRSLSEKQEDFGNRVIKDQSIGGRVEESTQNSFRTAKQNILFSHNDDKPLITLQKSIDKIYGLIERASLNYGNLRMNIDEYMVTHSNEGKDDVEGLKDKIRKMNLQLVLCQKELEITKDVNQIAQDTSKFMLRIFPLNDFTSRLSTPSIPKFNVGDNRETNKEWQNSEHKTSTEVNEMDASISSDNSVDVGPEDYMEIDSKVQNPISMTKSKCPVTDEMKTIDENKVNDAIALDDLNASIKLPAESFISFPTRSSFSNDPVYLMINRTPRHAKSNEPTFYRKSVKNASPYQKYYACEWNKCKRFYLSKKELK
ncbi:6592_t:CDS:2, partial [Acaulospora morrowiae]